MAKHLDVQQSLGAGRDIVLIRFLETRLSGSDHVQETADELAALVDEGHKKFVLALTDLEFIGSASLNALVVFLGRVKGANGELRICGLKPCIQEVFALSRLNQVFVIKNSEKEALANF